MRFRSTLGAMALLALVIPSAAVAGTDGHRHHARPDRIELPDGWQPEGLTTDGKYLYVGSMRNGAIWRANPRTGAGRVLAPGVPGRVDVGVEYDRRRDLLWVAGADSNQIRVQDADSGRLLRTYRFPSSTPRFLNDLVVTRRALYATDSLNQELAVVPFRHARHSHSGRHLPPVRRATTLPLTGTLVYRDGLNLNGIVKSHGRLLAVQSNTGKLFRINGRTGNTHEVDLDGRRLVNGDGLELDGDTLYAVRNMNSRVAVVDLNHRWTRGEVERVLSDPDLDVPATAALIRHSLWAVNARFSTPPTPETEYWITRLDTRRR